VLADAFDNVGLFGKQESWLVFASGHRLEVGSFAVMIKHGGEQSETVLSISRRARCNWLSTPVKEGEKENGDE
jgi:hypothetical protein